MKINTRKMTARRIGFWAALAMLLGSVIGTGVFLKNMSIAERTGQNGWSILFAWVLGGIISLCSVLSFSEMARLKTRRVHGIAAYAELFIGKKFGYFVRFTLPVFYSSVLALSMGLFASEIMFKVINGNFDKGDGKSDVSMWVHAVVGLCFAVVFIVLNFVSIYSSGLISMMATMLKILPIVVGIFGGIIFMNTNNNKESIKIGDQVVDYGTNWFTNPKSSFQLTAVLASIPSVLFAYDSWVNALSFAERVKGTQKTVNRVMVSSVVITAISYVFISISQMLHGSTTIENLLSQIFPVNRHETLQTITWSLIVVSVLGTTNSFTAISVIVFQQAVKTETLFGTRTLLKRYSLKKVTVILFSTVYMFWAMLIYIPSVVWNTDEFADLMLTYPVFFVNVIYGFIICGYWLKRKDIKIKKMNNFFFKIVSTVAVASIVIISCYNIFYEYTIKCLIYPGDISPAGFINSRNVMLNIHGFIFFLITVVLVLGLPILNALLAKRFEKNLVAGITQTSELVEVEWDDNFQVTRTVELDLSDVEDITI